MINKLIALLNKLVALAQERNTLALESLSELRDIHELLKDNDSKNILRVLHEIEAEQDKQTNFLGQIVTELLPPQPGVVRTQRIIFALPK